MVPRKHGGAVFAPAFLPALCACAFAALAFVPAVKVLSITNCNDKSQKLYSAAAARSFAIAYTHSVNKGRVRDYYSTSGGRLVLERTVFVSYGAGIPEPGETEGAVFAPTDEGYQISGLNRALDELVMAVGVTANHAIIVAQGESALTDFFAPQTRLVLKIKRVPLLDYALSAKL